MAALAVNRLVPVTKMIDAVQGGIVLDMAVVASDIIYQGAFLEVLAAGHVQPAGVGASLQGAGVALEKADNASGAAGDITVPVLVGAIVQHACTATIANIGDPVYASDDQTLTVTAGTNALMGWCVQFVSANVILVWMKPPGLPLT